MNSGVKILGQRNIFEAGAVEVTQLFVDYLEGNVQPGSCMALALSERPLGDTERTALRKAIAALGYGDDACTYATLAPVHADVEGNDIALDAQALFLLVEGLDPLCVVAADDGSRAAIAHAYRTELPADSSKRLLGRPTVAFADLGRLLSSDVGKRKAWELLKTMSPSSS